VDLSPLSAKQRAASVGSVYRLNILDGSVRSGKTFASQIAWLRFLDEGPKGPQILVGKNERTVQRNIIHPLTEMVGGERCRYIQNTGILHLFARRIYVVGANDERSQEKIRGLTLAGAYVDEASTIPESFWQMLLSRLSIRGARLFATTNPDSPMHWLKVNYLDHAALWVTGEGGTVKGNGDSLDLGRFSFRLADNETLPAEYIKQISREYTGLWHKRFIDGEWCVAEGAVYEGWDPARHVIAPDRLPPLSRLLVAGVDYGTTAPTAGLLLGVSSEERPRLVVVDEWAPPSLTDAGLSAGFRKWVGAREPERVAIDPSAASFHKQLWADGVSGVVLADNAVIDGIRTVASLLAVDRLVVSSACTNLLTEIPGYSWDPKATARGKDEPVKQNDHWCDALRYAVATTQSRWRNLVPLTLPVESEDAA